MAVVKGLSLVYKLLSQDAQPRIYVSRGRSLIQLQKMSDYPRSTGGRRSARIIGRRDNQTVKFLTRALINTSASAYVTLTPQ